MSHLIIYFLKRIKISKHSRVLTSTRNQGF